MAKILLLLVTLFSLLQLSVQQECSASNLCPIGCCSRSGYCGFGPEYCGTGCLSGCDRKSDCNPGTWNSTIWSKSEKCPLNVCCSKYGFCGTTQEFCANNPVKRPSCSVNSTPVTRVIGYYESWSTANRPCYSMLPEKVPFGYYTDVIFSFATIDPTTFEIKAGDSNTADYMQRINAIKLIQPDVRIWIAVGGWAFNDPGPTQTTFSDIAASLANTKKFIDSLVKMMNQYSFDGIDIDWEYPVAEDRKGRGVDFKNFVTFQKALYDRMKGGGLKKLVSLTLPASYWYLQHFDIANLQKYVDWFNIMSYDMHGSWDIENKWTGPYANSHTNMTEIQDALDLLWRNEIKPEKVTFGMAFYSRSFTLTDQSCTAPGCRVSSGGNAGKCSKTTGVLLHPEIADEIKNRGLTPVLHREAAVKTVAWGDQWVSFDDAATWRLKANIIRGQCIPGVMVWAMSQDDDQATNIKALTSAVGRKQMDPPVFAPPPQPVLDLPQPAKLCRWSGCYSGCPAGFKHVQREGHEEIMMNGENCLAGGSSVLCCPSDQELPVCRWRGHNNAGDCHPGCESGEVEVGSLRAGCNLRHQSACCTETASTRSYGMCKWIGSAPSCNGGTCPSDFPHKVVSTRTGAGGEQPCNTGEKSYCCRSPPPADFTDCEWVKKGNPPRFEGSHICEDTCGPDRIKVATEVTNPYTGGNSGCFGGAWAYCCKPPPPAIVPRGDDDPFGGKQNKEFQTLLEDYMQNPTCPATILVVDPGNMFTKKRSLEMEAAEYRILSGRATDCKLDHFERLVSFAAVMLTMTGAMLDALKPVWNDRFAGHYDEILEVDSLQGIYHDNPRLDPNSWMRYIILNPTAAGQGLRRAQQTQQTFCEYPNRHDKKRAAVDLLALSNNRETIGSVQQRHVFWLPTTTNGQPHMGIILEGILNGDLSLHYARWSFLDNQNGPMLELAYWIGRVPGQPGPSATHDRYRDMHRNNGGRPDRWVVFHIHINTGPERSAPNQQFLRQINGRTYIGVENVQVFHGYQTDQTNPQSAWRVDNMDGRRNDRDGVWCQEDSLWWFGSNVALPNQGLPTDIQFQQRLLQWSQRVFNEGYMASRGLDLILWGSGRVGQQGDIDPQNIGRFLGNWERHPSWGQAMYQVNFLITNGISYDFAPQDPGNN